MERATTERPYKNISYLFLLILVFVGLGFFKTYFGLFPRFEGLPTIAHFHAIGFLLWIALLVVQPLLIRYNQLPLHRLLGKFSYFLVPYIVLTVFGMSHEAYRVKGNSWLLAPQPPSLFFAVIGLGDFLFFYVLAIIYRRDREYHMRYIIATSLALIEPSLGRFFAIWLKLGPVGGILTTLTVFSIFIGLMVYDKVKFGKVHRAYIVAFVFTLLLDVAVPVVPPTHLWQSIALRIGRYLG
ncbi:MAG: hypothetical protein WBH24_21095 [Candidatus Acidiferrum sp.]|jgi:hypothetical protein